MRAARVRRRGWRPRATILVKLLAAFALPTIVLFTVFAFVAYKVSSDDLDAELGTRMAAVASSAASQLRGKYLTDLQPGDDTAATTEDELTSGQRAYQNTRNKLSAIAAATGVRLFVFDRDFGAKVDTDNGVAIGERYYQVELDRLEIARVFARGASVSSVTFEGNDGTMYKAGYAPVRADAADDPGADTDGDVVLAIGAQAPAVYFARLAALRRSLIMWGAALLFVVLAATVLSAYVVTRNVRRLGAAAERIGRGELTVPVPVMSGDELGLLAETMDRMRGQLAERDARLQQMLAGIAHEVRNPLAGMTLFAGILRDELPNDESGVEARGHVDKIARELSYLERVVVEFLEYARRPALECEALDLRRLLDEVAQLAQADCSGVGVEVEANGEISLVGDRVQLRRALLNLAQNAVQASAKDASPVRLVAQARAGEVEILVENHGPEISVEHQEKIFEPFFTTREKGTGLGLAFVRDIALAHGGSVESTSSNGLTVFRLLLPISTSVVPEP